MSSDGVKGELEQTDAQPVSEPPVRPSSGTEQGTKQDTDGEDKIRADAEEQEKRSEGSGSRSGSRSSKSPTTPRSGRAGSQDGRKSGSPSRTSSPGKKSPGSRPHSSDRPKSSCSGDITIETKTSKRSKLMESTEEGHEVNFTVTISVAVPTDMSSYSKKTRVLRLRENYLPLEKTILEEEVPHIEDDNQPDIHDLIKKKKRVFEAPRAQNYYHLEYYLVPDNDELMKTDVVTYGMGAKVYMEKSDPFVKKTWQDGDVTWIAWTQKHKLHVTKELLLKLYTHTLELRLWDTKDKVGTRAKFDRPKLFKLPTLKQGDDVDEMGGVKSIVSEQCRSFTEMQPKKGREIRPLPKEITYQKQEPTNKRREASPGAREKASSRTSGDKAKGQRATSPTPHTLVAVPNRDDDNDGRSSFSRLGRLAGHEESPGSGGGADSRTSKVSSKKSRTVSQTSKSRMEQISTPTSKTARQGAKSAASSGSSKAVAASHQGSVPKRRNRRAEQAALTAAENIKKNGICMIPIRMAILFSGVKKVTNRLETPVPGIEDAFVTLQMDEPLLDEKQKQELNPMIIKIHSGTAMPSTPMPFDQLKDKCQPVYCRYSFFKLPPHCTLKRPQASNVYWDDVNVILAGTFEQSEFCQYLNGPPLDIEVHDRDRKPEAMKLKAALFGDDLEDEKISNVGTVASRRTLHNPFKDKGKVWDPYGVAKVDLSDLLLGHRFLYIKVPVHGCPPPDLLGTTDNGKMAGKLVGLGGAVDGPIDSPMAAGHYVTSNTMLKIKVELAHPLVTPEAVAAKEPVVSTNECPFGRIVFKFDYKNTVLLNQLQSLVTKINARALELDDMPQHVIDAALSTYKLSGLQQQSRSLDIITGFQVLDGTMHMFVLEGLRDLAIREVWMSLPQPENSDVVVLYNSNLTFSERLYGPLDVDLCRVKLHEPLSRIVQQPLLYVRDMVPKPCFEALVKLHELTKVTNVRNAVRTDLFPTADMVVSMSKEFGVPFTTQDFEELQVRPEKSFISDPGTVTREPTYLQESSRYWDPIDNINITYMERLIDREKTGIVRDFLKEHKTEVRKASNINKREKDMNKPPTVKADVAVAHNYSTQTLNSTDLAKEKLRQMLAQDPDTRYTYCQDYLHSMTVVPVNLEALKKQEKEESEAQWKTEEGWIYPGMQTTLEANENPKKPHPARIDELQERWRENILHVGLLQAPLERDRFDWDLRDKDLELYKRPEVNFGVPEPNTIHLAGEKLKQEKLAAQRHSHDIWRSKIVVENTRQFFHRCLTETELKAGGRKASNQLARLQGLLKDSPEKLSLRRPAMTLRNIPPLNVVLNPSVDTDARLAGRPTLPAVENEGIESNKGFKPGPFIEHGWALERNKIPAVDYDHDTFEKLKGNDFNVYHKERSRMWRRPIIPLTDDERDNHLFRLPDDPKRYRVLPDLGHSLGERSMTQPQISTLNAEATLSQPQLSKLTVPTSFNDPTFRMSTEPTGMLSAQQTVVSPAITGSQQQQQRVQVAN